MSNSLPTKESFLESGLKPGECEICNEPFSTKNDHECVELTRCGHYFGDSCIMTWLRHSNTCPRCRSELFQQSPPNQPAQSHTEFFPMQLRIGDAPSHVSNTISAMILQQLLERVESSTRARINRRNNRQGNQEGDSTAGIDDGSSFIESPTLGSSYHTETVATSCRSIEDIKRDVERLFEEVGRLRAQSPILELSNRFEYVPFDMSNSLSALDMASDIESSYVEERGISVGRDSDSAL